MDGSIKYTVRLSAERRAALEELTRNGSAPAKKIMHAQVLLMSDANHERGRYHDHEISTIRNIHINTVARIRKLFVLQGESPAIDRKQRQTPPNPPRLDGHAEAQLIAICCSKPPEGRIRWTLSLLQKECVGRKIVTSISEETIRKTLKKTSFNPGASSGSAFPNATRLAMSRRWNRCLMSMPNR
jgi:hypothetical protein